jgi:hypothetical protein
MRRYHLLPLVVTVLSILSAAIKSGDGYVSRNGDTWTLGTAKVERKITLSKGRFFAASIKDKVSGRDLVKAGGVSEELRLSVDGHDVSGTSGGWKLMQEKERLLPQGEIQLDIRLQRAGLEATKTYVVYPGSSIIREWVNFKNVGSAPLVICDPRFLNLTATVGPPESVDFDWMAGGDNRPGSWNLRTEKLLPAQSRSFDSYDPLNGSASGNYAGDGVITRVLLNNQQVWPVKSWRTMKWGYAPNADTPLHIDAEANVWPGDKLVFVVNRFGTMNLDTTSFDPTVTYADGEQHTASKEFGNSQNKNGWKYQHRPESTFGNADLARFYESRPLSHQSQEPLKLLDLAYDESTKQWRIPGDNKADDLFIASGVMHPGLLEDAVLVWTAPKAGKVQINANVVNIANRAVAGAGREPHMGSAIYAPWNALMNRKNGDGFFMGWDYFGHWASSFTAKADGAVDVDFKVAGYRQKLAPGESLTTPMAFVGTFQKDLDNAGNEVLDWQYRYLWDYTRDGWFPGIRQAGWWVKGTAWPDPNNSRVLGKGPLTLTHIDDADRDSTFRKIFRLADLLSEEGADVYHRDCCWWDSSGALQVTTQKDNGGGPDFRTTGIYLRKHSMGQLIYRPIILDTSKPDAVANLERFVDNLHDRYGTMEWRTDGPPIAQTQNGDDTVLLAEDQGFREILRHYLDKHPEDAFQACNGGGNEVGYDYARYASSISFSDGAVGMLRNYWASLILPPDKIAENGDFWEIDKFDKSIYRGLLTMGFDNAGDTWEPEKVEGMRELIDIYHYLESQGVVGRWVHVYRPFVSGDDPTMYFERLSRDEERGIIIPKQPAPGPVTIKPKGLLPDKQYVVSYQESSDGQTRSGTDLMQNGINIQSMMPGELIYLNLPYHPGNKVDKARPTAPVDPHTQQAVNMEYPGVELTWKPGHDDQWVSYYEVLRDGVLLDKVAKGTYFFDHSAGADLAAKYEVRTVDGAGLRSGLVGAESGSRKRVVVLDDSAAAIHFTGGWRQQSGLQPAYLGTISGSDVQGASFEMEFEGTKFTWFTKLCDDCGKAGVSIDGEPDTVVNTYSADDIWGVGVYSKTFSSSGKHKAKISVLGQPPDAYGTGTSVYLDGIQVQP